MDAAFEIAAPLLRQDIESKDLTSFWDKFWGIVEGTTLDFAGNGQQTNRRNYIGRGGQPVQFLPCPVPRATEQGDDLSLHTPAWLSSIVNHANRCQHMIANLNILQKGKLSEEKQRNIRRSLDIATEKVVLFLKWQMTSSTHFSGIVPMEPNGSQRPQQCRQEPENQPLLFNPEGLISKLTDADATMLAKNFRPQEVACQIPEAPSSVTGPPFQEERETL
jgi:hypothetical protein